MVAVSSKPEAALVVATGADSVVVEILPGGLADAGIECVVVVIAIVADCVVVGVVSPAAVVVSSDSDILVTSGGVTSAGNESVVGIVDVGNTYSDLQRLSASS